MKVASFFFMHIFSRSGSSTWRTEASWGLLKGLSWSLGAPFFQCTCDQEWMGKTKNWGFLFLVSIWKLGSVSGPSVPPVSPSLYKFNAVSQEQEFCINGSCPAEVFSVQIWCDQHNPPENRWQEGSRWEWGGILLTIWRNELFDSSTALYKYATWCHACN